MGWSAYVLKQIKIKTVWGELPVIVGLFVCKNGAISQQKANTKYTVWDEQPVIVGLLVCKNGGRSANKKQIKKKQCPHVKVKPQGWEQQK